MTEQSKACLSPSAKKLVEMMQALNFGRIEELMVRNGEPIFDTPPRVTREIKLAGENGPHPQIRSDDFVLKAEVIEMFRQFNQLRDGIVQRIEVKHGLPFLLVIEEPKKM